jgi:hypothetical protein
MLEHTDETLNSIGDWDECHTHFRYIPSMPISVVGRVPRSTQPAFWANHLSQFRTAIPSKIITEFLQQPKQQRAAWAKLSYSNAAKVLQGQSTDTKSANTAQPSTGQSHVQKRVKLHRHHPTMIKCNIGRIPHPGERPQMGQYVRIRG